MASQWLETDIDALGRLAMLWDLFYSGRKGADRAMAEIRQQEQRFGLAPLDRSRLQWEVNRGEEAEQRRERATPVKRTGTDPRNVLVPIK
jgi:hypothetical protein